MRFFSGLAVGLVLLGSYIGYTLHEKSENPCLDACGVGTICVEGVCLVQGSDEPKARKKRRRRRRHRKRRARAGAPAAAAAEDPGLRKPTPADLRVSARGASLRKTDYINLSSSGGGSSRELTTAEINKKVRSRDRHIVACIDRARADIDINQGKVVVGLRIERSGRVKKVRVTAPAALQRAGLYACIKPLITGLRFPAARSAQIMSYPYSLY